MAKLAQIKDPVSVRPFLVLRKELWPIAREVYGDTIDLYEPQEVPREHVAR
jgi:hypothetical protein